MEEAKAFALTPQTRRLLSDPGATLRHPVAGDLSLRQVFVYPDLREVRYDQKAPGALLRSGDLIASLRQSPHLLIAGPDRCGKTSLSKVIAEDLHAAGFVPLLLDGATVPSRRPEDLARHITKAFADQYSPSHTEQYRQHARERKALIIDDFHLTRFSRGSRQACLDLLFGHAAIVILLSHDVTTHAADLLEAGPLGGAGGDFKQYAILPFGHARRNELIERWLALDPSQPENASDISRRVMEIKRIMDTAIGTNFVPSFPIFLLPMLQAYEHSQPVDVGASTYGYFYELLIRQALAHDMPREQFDIYVHYLGYVADEMQRKGIFELTDGELRAVHERFEADRLLQVSYVSIVLQLVRRHLLVETDNIYRFRYPYIAYYFMASFMRDHIEDAPVRERIIALTGQLQDETNANVLLFIAHLSKNSFIVDAMLAASRGVLADEKRENLSSLGPARSSVDREAVEVALLDAPTHETRAAWMEQLDQVPQSGADTTTGTGDEVDDYLRRIGGAFKSLQILGQMLKSFPGSMDGAHKLELTRACRDIGMRILGSFARTLDEAKEEVVREAVSRLRLENPDVAAEEVARHVNESVFALLHYGSFGVLRRVAAAIASPHLETVYDRVESEEASLFMTLVRTALRLEHSRGFPSIEVLKAQEILEANALGALALRRMVVTHFHLFEEPISLRQRICEKLGIPFRRTVGLASSTRLISPSKRKDS